MPTLYMMVGIPGSGKSTYARRLRYTLNNCVYVSRDEIRERLREPGDSHYEKEGLVYCEFISKINKALATGAENVIADATHISKGSRFKFIKNIRNPQNIDLVYVIMDTPFETCKLRNSLREGNARVPSNVMEDMWTFHNFPDMAEVSRYKFNSVKFNVVRELI